MTAAKALLIDLDDTLYPQAQFLAAAWEAVATASTLHGSRRSQLVAALHEITAAGSAQGRIIDQALQAIDATHIDASTLVAAFCEFRPTHLQVFERIEQTLAVLQRRYRLALVTDGIPDQQRAKLTATGLAKYFEVVVCSDDLGRNFRKPHALPFTTALGLLDTAVDDAIMIGDSPHKDIAGASALGLRSIRVRTGEYGDLCDDATVSVASFSDVVTAIAEIDGYAAARNERRTTSTNSIGSSNPRK